MAETSTILVVDDNEMNRDMLARRLERQGYTVDVADDGDKALQTLRQKPYDLVLLDIMMPRLNGYETLEEIKMDETLQHIPVIMISAVDELDSIVKCIELGAEDYLFKPFNPVLLRARVKASLEKRKTVNSVIGIPVEKFDSLKADVQTEVQGIEKSLQSLLADEQGALNPQQKESIQAIALQVQQITRRLAKS